MTSADDRLAVPHVGRSVAALVMAMSLLACTAAPAGSEFVVGEGLRLDLALDRAPDAPIVLRIALRNGSDVPVTVDATGTPFETPLSADVFDVRRGDEPVEYLGRLVKRSGGRPSDTFELAPSEERVALIDLGAHYALIPGERHSVSPRRVVLDGTARFAGLSDVRVRPADGVSFVP